MATAAHIDAGLPGRMAAAGLWGSVQSVTGAQLAAGVQDRVQVCTRGAALAGDGGGGGGALQSEAQRQQREPGALFLEQSFGPRDFWNDVLQNHAGHPMSALL